MIERFFVWPIAVQRHLGANADSDSYEPIDESLLAKITTGNQLVRDGDGDEVVTSTRIDLPSSTPTIPSESLVTLPGRFGGRTVRVVAEAVNDAGRPGFPSFYRLDCT